MLWGGFSLVLTMKLVKMKMDGVKIQRREACGVQLCESDAAKDYGCLTKAENQLKVVWSLLHHVVCG